ncbi:MAG: LamG-like jellyroll fold domain-containing protein [Verrucomicrobiota bacterium]
MATAPAYWWRLDETGVTPPHMMATNRGSVGPAANGLVTGLTPNKTGCIRDSFWFDNFMSDAYFSGNRVDVPLQPAFSNAGPFTIELWAKNYYYLRYYGSGFAVSCWSVTNAAVFQAGGWCLLQSFSQVGTSFYHNWTFRVSTAIPWGTKTFAYYDITSPALETNSPQTQWTHVAGVYDGTNIFLYLNGQRCTTSIYSNGVAMPGAISTPGWFSPPFQGFRIGAGFDFVTNNYIWSICRGYNGRLDEVAYYANALSSNTIFSHYAAATTNVSGYGAQIIADGAVGYWPFDDSAPDPGTLPVATNSGTLSPRATGLITPGCTPGVAGVPHPTFGADNRACLFDGNAYIDCGTNDLVRSNSITVSAWAKPDATTNGDWEGIVSSGFYLFWLAMDSAGHARFAYGNMVNSGWKPLDSGVRIDDGQWHHLVGVFDGAGVALYVDGQLTASTNSISIVGSYRYNILIGAHPGDFLVSGSPNCSEAIQGRPFYYSYGSAYSTYGSPLTMMNWTGFRGAIDDVVIWTNALTGAQIQQLYSSATNAVVQTTPVFQPPTRSGNTLFLNWSAISGRSYQVQYKTNLTQSNWGTLTTLTATNATVSFPDDMTADRQRFYRVVLMP